MVSCCLLLLRVRLLGCFFFCQEQFSESILTARMCLSCQRTKTSFLVTAAFQDSGKFCYYLSRNRCAKIPVLYPKEGM